MQKSYLIHPHDHNCIKNSHHLLFTNFLNPDFFHFRPISSSATNQNTILIGKHCWISISLVCLKCLPSTLTFAKKYVINLVCLLEDRRVIFDDLNFSRCKEGPKELLFSKCQCLWHILEADLKKGINSPFRKWAFGMWLMKNRVKMKKKRLGRGSPWKESGSCFSYSYDLVGGAGRLLVSLSPVNINRVV